MQSKAKIIVLDQGGIPFLNAQMSNEAGVEEYHTFVGLSTLYPQSSIEEYACILSIAGVQVTMDWSEASIGAGLNLRGKST